MHARRRLGGEGRRVRKGLLMTSRVGYSGATCVSRVAARFSVSSTLVKAAQQLSAGTGQAAAAAARGQVLMWRCRSPRRA